MASYSNKKLSILYVLDILKDYSDASHPLTQQDIIDKIYSIYGMECERKSISSNVDSLIDFGFDIEKTQRGCCLAGREFEVSEIQFLIDAIFSSRSIDSKHSKELINKLSGFLSVYQRNQYKYVYKASEITRTDNKQLFYTIDVLNEAIEKGKKVKFNYNRFYYDQKQKEEKRNKTYIINPYFLVNSQGKYYIVCNNEYFDEVANYRVERIENIQILDNPAKPITSLKGCEKGIDITKYINENIYMFSNKTISATIKIENEHSANFVMDWFGNKAEFYKKDGELFADLKTNEQAMIYWCLQYGESIQLVKPVETRQKIAKILKEMLTKYKN